MTATTLANGLKQPSSVALDDANVYFTSYVSEADKDTVWKVSKAGGPATVVADHQSVPMGLAADATGVYWANYDAGGPDGAIMAARGGQPAVKLASAQSPRGVVIDATDVYYLTSSALMALPKAGGTPRKIASAQCGDSLASDGANFYWSVDCVMSGPRGIVKLPKSGGSPTFISNEAAGTLAVDASGVYWFSWPGKVKGISASGRPFTVGSLPTEFGGAVATDAASVYVSSGTSIYRFAKGQPNVAPVEVAKGSHHQVEAIATDATNLFFADWDLKDGALAKAAK